MRLETTIRAKWRYNDCKSIDEMINIDLGYVEHLKELNKIFKNKDVSFTWVEGGKDDYVDLEVETKNKKIIKELRKKFCFHQVGKEE